MSEPYNPKKKYCGPGNGLLAWLVADRVWGVPINECCFWHDEAYRIGGTGKDRAKADTLFRQCISRKFKESWVPNWLGDGGTGKDRATIDATFRACIEREFRLKRMPRWLGRMVARRYWLGVRAFGSSRFNYTG